jgi:predicted nucleic acid-binding protein
MIVVDTNIIGYLYLSSDRSTQAEQAFIRDPHWVAPLLWRSEFRNVLALYIRKQLLSLAEAQQIIDEATNLMQSREHLANSSDVLRLVASSTCSAYDCEFVALATSLNVPLVTVDKQILEQFPQVALSLDEFINI